MSLKSGKLSLDDLKNGSTADVSDTDLDQAIKENMRAHSDLDEIKNDPFYSQTVSMLNKSDSENNKKIRDTKDREREDFIKGALKEKRTQDRISTEIKSIHYEMGKSNINDLTAEWVNEWHRRKQKEITATYRERKSFISESLKSSDKPAPNTAEKPIVTANEKPVVKKRQLRYVYLSAAASLIGAALIFTALLSPSSPEKLFDSYYEPYQAISPVMRDGNSASSSYASAIMYYKSGDLNKAAYYFQESSLNDPTLRSPVFYLGLTELANGRFDDAINRFRSITDVPGIYSKEAKWYLGLSYLKKGDVASAKECFSDLSKADGYYMERSEKILRRLK
ncbi:MAG TPA: tetratricopeptide repeat protein [Bacteroidales bacterium]|nr:tetratricopeptide repeat protein [Bacteroidales bacterium]